MSNALRLRASGAWWLWVFVALALIAGCTSERIASGRCEFDADCPSGQVCASNQCRPSCRTDADCATGLRCVASGRDGVLSCVPPSGTGPACQRDSDCADGLACLDRVCQMQCVRDYDCQVINPSSRCTNGRCVSMCPDPRADCDGRAANGCEVDTSSDASHCGACGNACPAAANGTATCSNGRCAVRCSPSFGDCDMMASNGCEVSLSVDRAHCGMCGRACAASQVCSGGECAATCTTPGELRCGDRCVDTQRDVAHCGACDNVCARPARGVATCQMGRCGVRCDEGFADCDGDATNGCEVDLSSAEHCGMCGRRCAAPTPSCMRSDGGFACSAEPCVGTMCGGVCVNTSNDVRNCGTCGAACPAGPASEARCEAGRCTLRCTMPTLFADCDGMPSNGCETELPRSTTHCGACGMVCATGNNAATSCNDGACGLRCNAGFGNCDGMLSNGCEVDTRSNVSHCGGCGLTCSSPANASATCTMGSCAFTCDTNFADCDSDATNGCEVNTSSDRAHCGACGRACATGEVCSAGMCRSSCAAEEANCEGSCAVLSSSLTHCGACGRACATPVNAAAACRMGVCGFACDTGFGDCDDNPANGCETSLRTSATSCGRCGNACALDNAVAACDAGRCVIGRCNTGFADCDGNAANGCEVDTRSAASHCGACGRSCRLANATAACAAGACVVASCNAGFANCDGDASNGCEVDTTTNVAHCGGCGMACNAAGGVASCMMGQCRIACSAGRADCNSSTADGCEVDLNSSASHCGRCGNVCSLADASSTCRMGVCAVASCNTGFGNCDGSDANGCETNVTNSATHCGRCGNTCMLPNAVSSCASGACVITRCNTGFADCDGNAVNGCEVNVLSDAAHCGTCRNACSNMGGLGSCVAGMCSITCFTGRANCNMSLADGCEVDTTVSVTHCGACGRTCTLANATAVCSMSTCAIGTCNAGFADCDRNASNGCEADTRSDVRNCGTCGRACTGAEVCSGSMCTLACGAGETNCGGRCVNLNSDVNHCRACGVMCATRANATPTCTATGCGFTCNAGFGNCDAMDANGCETATNENLNHCGRCGVRCAPANATGVCTAGMCGIATCNAGFADCDGNAANGCEVNLQTDLAHCGRCATRCAPANATGTCAAGVCGIAACNAGFADCDGNPANGCEVNTATDPANCGRCRNTCSLANATSTCTAGMCTVRSCNTGFGNCDGNAANGCEVNTTNTVAHCGGCGMACSNNHGTPSCSASTCLITCERTAMCTPTCTFSSLWGDCNGNARSDGCEVNLLTTSSCGACGTMCSFANAAAMCSVVGPACAMGACNTGFGNCNMTAADGCEVNLTNNDSNCGSCGTNCARLTGSTNYPHACRTSVCRPGNDACANATPINLAAGRKQWFEALTAGATADLVPPCQSSAGPDVFFSFTLTQRELVYADTMGDATHPGPSWNTILYLANGCTTAMTGAPMGQRYCSDDARSEGCEQDGNRSQVYAVLNPGTYYLVVSGVAGATGRSWVHFEHMPVGNGNAIPLNVTPGMSQTHRGTTAGAGQIATPTCGGAGPEVSYWWRTCTDGRRHTLTATTCDMFTNFDTVLWLRNGDTTAAPDVCNDDNARCTVRRTSSEVSGVIHAGTGLHVLTVDGFNASSAGNYQLVLNP